jgi:hypothetical protein
MVFSLEHDIKITKNHQNLLPTQTVLVAHTVLENAENNEENNCKHDHNRSELLGHWVVKDK